MNVIAPDLEKQFRDELETIGTYVGTRFVQGLMPTASGDLNPADVILRYSDGIGYEPDVADLLKNSLEALAADRAASFNIDRSARAEEKAKWLICLRFYGMGAISKNKETVFADWLRSFKEFGIKVDGTDTVTPPSDSTV